MFPKDLSAFIRIAEVLGIDASFLRAVIDINEGQKKGFIERIRKQLWNLKGKTLGILGLSFKPETDDMRFAPSIGIIQALAAEGAHLRLFDPQAMPEAKKIFHGGVTFVKNAYEAARGADALVILTEWPEFLELDLKRIKKLLRHSVLFDGRNLYERARMEKLGFQYVGVGR